MPKTPGEYEGQGIAIIGMAGRFPGATSIAEYWRNLCAGVESIEFATDEELVSARVSPAQFRQSDYVRAGGNVQGADFFDASFFGMNAREAEILDPQQRVFLECCWDAFEDAGYDPLRSTGAVGVFAGVGMNTYSLTSLFGNEAILATAGAYQIMLGNDKDFLASRVAYKLNLRGPAISVQTACSTSLVAVQMAFESLRRGECDAALAGGVSISFPQNSGYQYVPGMILSPDGHCRAFDASSAGTVPGRGAGVVLLKRLADAIADRDYIYAVIRGAAINNDGSAKAGYSAPSVEGQTRVIAKSLEMAGFASRSVRYVEAHGTGTSVGDPIEVAALSQAFGAADGCKQFCALGSVKTNIGHLDTAAGVAGLIKASLSVRHRLIPPTLHYQTANPLIPFEESPFYVNSSLVPYTAPEPFRAGVSSFGIGGTNAHVSIEEIALPQDSCDPRPQLVVLSARSEEAVAARSQSLEKHLQENPDVSLADVAWTLQQGRHPLRHRRAFVAASTAQARQVLATPNAPQVRMGVAETQEREVVFVFPGQGAQYVDMGRGLYTAAPVFRNAIDACSEILQPLLGLDLRRALYPSLQEKSSAEAQLGETWLTQPALFATEYALSQLWISCGVSPVAMLGHSIGEYVAACLAGIFSLEDSLRLIALRGKLIFSLPVGAMLAVSLPETEVAALLPPELSIAAVNAPSQTVVSGPVEAVDSLERNLKSRGIDTKLLRTSHAFHSAMLDPIGKEFVEQISRLERKAPSKPILSNLSGTWLSEAEATSAEYWGRHLRETVRFADCAAAIAQRPEWLVVEAGPGETLLSLFRRRSEPSSQVRISSMRQALASQDDYETWLNAVCRFWLAGCAVNWPGVHASYSPRRVPLPGYPFERQRFWIGPASNKVSRSNIVALESDKKPDIADWFYVPSWRKSSPLEPPHAPTSSDGTVCLVLGEVSELCNSVLSSFQGLAPVILISSSDVFQKHSDSHFSLTPHSRQDWEKLLRALADRGLWPERIVHTWSLRASTGQTDVSAELDRGFFSLMALVQAIGNISSSRQVIIKILTSQAYSVAGEPVLNLHGASLSGLAKVVAIECPNIRCSLVDVGAMDSHLSSVSLTREFNTVIGDRVVALRNGTRWTQTFDAIQLPSDLTQQVKLEKAGIYLITGGLGGLGLVFAETLARLTGGQFVLTRRTPFPAEDEWSSLLADPSTPVAIVACIQGLLRIRAAGGRVHVLQADAADTARMHEVVAWCRQHAGGLHGVIHAAGIPSQGALLTKTREGAEQVLQPKIQGTVWIEELLREAQLDFVLLCSSINSIIPAPGLSDYAAGNMYLDAFAARHDNPLGTRVIAANWDTWTAVGMAANSGEESGLAHVITPEEGAVAFERILALPSSQVVISTRNPNLVLDKQEAMLKSFIGQQPESRETGPLHPRPALSQPYVEPSDETERAVTEMWSELLGIDEIGKHDNFFELGGHSLLGIQVMVRIRQRFGLDLPLRTVFEAPTPAEIANLLRTIHWASGYSNSTPMVDIECEDIEF